MKANEDLGEDFYTDMMMLLFIIQNIVVVL